MNVYISCHHPNPANDLATGLKAAGHRVVSSWHSGDEPRPANDDAVAWRAKAVANFAAISDADALVLVAGPERYPGGKFVETGYAIACGLRVFTLGGVENGMLHGPAVEHAISVPHLLDLLADSPCATAPQPSPEPPACPNCGQRCDGYCTVDRYDGQESDRGIR